MTRHSPVGPGVWRVVHTRWLEGRGELAADEECEVDVEDRVGQLGKRLGVALEHVGGDELVHGADGGAEGVTRELGDLRDVSPRTRVDRDELSGEALLYDVAPRP